MSWFHDAGGPSWPVCTGLYKYINIRLCNACTNLLRSSVILNVTMCCLLEKIDSLLGYCVNGLVTSVNTI